MDNHPIKSKLTANRAKKEDKPKKRALTKLKSRENFKPR